MVHEDEARGRARPGHRVEGDDFYVAHGDAGGGNVKALLWRMAADRLRFAAVTAGIGFFAVFILQAPILYQVVLGAPIFEEFLKFGLAMLLVGGLRVLPLRMAAGFLVGAGFGVLEHAVTYSAEPDYVYVGRVLFHGGAAMLSMLCFHLLEPALDVRNRWWSTAAATFIHYLNNAVALLSLPLLVLGDIQFILALTWSTLMTSAVYASVIAFVVRPAWFTTRAEAWTQRFLR